jgi:hypothetical protein
MVTAAPPANFHGLLRWHLRRGTRPYEPYNPDWHWTQESFANAVGASNRESVTQWVGGKVPNSIRPLLDALFRDDPDLKQARVQLKAAWSAAQEAKRAKLVKARARLSGPPPAPATDWASQIDPTGAESLVPTATSHPDDIAEVARPMLRQRLPATMRKLETLCVAAHALHNESQDYTALFDATNELTRVLGRGIAALLLEGWHCL